MRGSALLLQLLHLTCFVALRCLTAAREEREGARGFKEDLGHLQKQLGEAFARKVLGLLFMQFLAWALACEVFCSLAPGYRGALARAAAAVTLAGVLLLCACRRRLQWRHPLDLVGTVMLSVLTAAVMAPALGATSAQGSLAAAAATIFVAWTLCSLAAGGARLDVPNLEELAYAGLLLFYPWAVALALLEAYRGVPTPALVRAVFDALSVLAVAVCSLTDLQRVLRGALTKRGFGMDSASLAAAALLQALLHVFLKASCWTLSSRRQRSLF